ncbi:hypothetical protein [Mycolicibacter icosiumassiliensis]|nr:hypothetical protein [Mycolicibacter icosiumassiliensis]
MTAPTPADAGKRLAEAHTAGEAESTTKTEDIDAAKAGTYT